MISGGTFQDEAGDPGLGRAPQQNLIVQHGEEDDGGAGMCRQKTSGHLESVQSGHADVEDQDVRSGGDRALQGLAATAGFADQLQATIGRDHSLQSGQHQRVIVCDKDPDPPGR